MIDPTTIQRIFDTADIVEVISEFVNLKKLRGKALAVFWSWNSENKRPRWNRICKLIR